MGRYAQQRRRGAAPKVLPLLPSTFGEWSLDGDGPRIYFATLAPTDPRCQFVRFHIPLYGTNGPWWPISNTADWDSGIPSNTPVSVTIQYADANPPGQMSDPGDSKAYDW